jgi:hypothetical protein
MIIIYSFPHPGEGKQINKGGKEGEEIKNRKKEKGKRVKKEKGEKKKRGKKKRER